MEIQERFVGKKSFSHQDVAADILYHEHKLCFLSKVSRRKRRDGI
jgi:hypothetical protein